jgi:hypothetical protein
MDECGQPATLWTTVTVGEESRRVEYDALWIGMDGTVHAMAFLANLKLAVLGKTNDLPTQTYAENRHTGPLSIQ